MSDWDEDWNISLAGCGFRSVYHVGALSCFLQEAPLLVHGASRICGASSGCLVAAAVVVGISVEDVCADVLSTAKEARKHALGVFHPTFSLLRTARTFLQQKLPEDAHLRASGRLCVSLTRISDRRNVLVSEFESREELIQVLVCSCFFPGYSGFIPPSYRGEFYMDGALSNNMPLFEDRNTITMAPFSGESDVCPKEGTFNFFESSFGNVSIQVNTGNVHRVCTSFLPPAPEKLAEICRNGYMDALRFLADRDLLQTQRAEGGAAGRELMEPQKTMMNGRSLQEEGHDEDHDEGHGSLDLNVIENLPESLKRVLTEACQDGHGGSRLSEFLLLLLLPVQLLLSATKRLLMLTADLCRTSSRKLPQDTNQRQRPRPSDLKNHHDGDLSHLDVT